MIISATFCSLLGGQPLSAARHDARGAETQLSHAISARSFLVKIPLSRPRCIANGEQYPVPFLFLIVYAILGTCMRKVCCEIAQKPYPPGGPGLSLVARLHLRQSPSPVPA